MNTGAPYPGTSPSNPRHRVRPRAASRQRASPCQVTTHCAPKSMPIKRVYTAKPVAAWVDRQSIRTQNSAKKERRLKFALVFPASRVLLAVNNNEPQILQNTCTAQGQGTRKGLVRPCDGFQHRQGSCTFLSSDYNHEAEIRTGSKPLPHGLNTQYRLRLCILTLRPKKCVEKTTCNRLIFMGFSVGRLSH